MSHTGPYCRRNSAGPRNVYRVVVVSRRTRTTSVYVPEITVAPLSTEPVKETTSPELVAKRTSQGQIKLFELLMVPLTSSLKLKLREPLKRKVSSPPRRVSDCVNLKDAETRRLPTPGIEGKAAVGVV